jgi:hypothetical protein
MKRPRSRPDRVGDALRHVLQRIDPERRLELFRMWAAEVGPAIAARSEPAGFRDGVLSVRVNGAAWMQELQFAKEEIRARLNARLGTEVVRDVYFVSGGGLVKKPARAAPPSVPAQEETDEPIELPPLRDQRLAEVFARIARAHRKRRREP